MRAARGLTALALLGLGACALESGKPARFWTIEDFGNVRPDAGAKFAGLEVTRLIAREGDPLPWRGAAAAKAGLVVWPGFSKGKARAFVITDLWDEHPLPWVQPTYLQVTAYDATNPFAALVRRADGSPTASVFPVGTDTRFYSPVWRATLVEVPLGSPADLFTDAPSILATRYPLHQGPLVLCPITAMDAGVGVSVAESPTGLEHPLTRAPQEPIPGGRAFVDGREIRYLSPGLGRALAEDDGEVLEFPAYFFVAEEGDDVTPLPLPPVMPDEPEVQSVWRRHDVVLQPPMGVYFATDLPAIRDAVERVGVATRVQAAGGTVPRDFSLRVAKDRACFDAATFPASCTWLDGVAAIQALPDSQRRPTGTLLTGAALLPKVTP